MRFIHLNKAADLHALSQQLGSGSVGNAATLAQIKTLNPHLNFAKLELGSMLLLPEGSELGAGKAAGADNLAAFQAQAKAGLGALNQRARLQAENLKTERQNLGSAMKSAGLKRLQEADPAFKKQLESAAEQAAADQKAAESTAKQLEAMDKLLSTELGRMGKFLG
jgi:hypothetical protein